MTFCVNCKHFGVFSKDCLKWVVRQDAVTGDKGYLPASIQKDSNCSEDKGFEQKIYHPRLKLGTGCS
jgi:hypothetical protein